MRVLVVDLVLVRLQFCRAQGVERLAPLLVAVGEFRSQLDDQLPLLFNQRLLLCDLCFQNLNRLQLRDHSVW